MCVYICICICSCDAGRLLLGHVAGDLRADVLLQPRPARATPRCLVCYNYEKPSNKYLLSLKNENHKYD